LANEKPELLGIGNFVRNHSLQSAGSIVVADAGDVSIPGLSHVWLVLHGYSYGNAFGMADKEIQN
jgi:hypothetical protein